jgi:hypothetical protein
MGSTRQTTGLLILKYKGKIRMKTLAIASVFALSTTAAMAADVGAELSLDFSENAAGDIVAEKSIDMALTGPMGVASIGLEAAADDTVKVDTYSLGTSVNGVAVSFGDQGDLMEGFEGGTESVGGQTLTDLDDDYESVKVEYSSFGFLLGFDDVSTDVGAIRNVQVSAGTQVGAVGLTGAINWDEATEDYMLGTKADLNVGAVGVAGTLTYVDSTSAVGYEVSAGYGDIQGFVNGDKDDGLQNIGGGVYKDMSNGLGFYAEAGYNIDAEEITPAAGVSFNF